MNGVVVECVTAGHAHSPWPLRPYACLMAYLTDPSSMAWPWWMRQAGEKSNLNIDIVGRRVICHSYLYCIKCYIYFLFSFICLISLHFHQNMITFFFFRYNLFWNVDSYTWDWRCFKTKLEFFFLEKRCIS